MGLALYDIGCKLDQSRSALRWQAKSCSTPESYGNPESALDTNFYITTFEAQIRRKMRAKTI